MMTILLEGQNLSVSTPHIVAGTKNYLSVEIIRGTGWSGLHLHVFFKQGATTYELLTDGNHIGPEAHINLTEGKWSVSVSGYEYDGDQLVMKITSNSIGLNVAAAPPESGSDLPYVPATSIEQIAAIAQSVRDDADAGVFNGEKGDKGDKGDPGDPPTDAQILSAVDEWFAENPTEVKNDIIADQYSSSGTYDVGDYVWHSGYLYKCTTAITAAEEWTAAHWENVALADDVAIIKSDIDYLTDASIVAYGDIERYLYKKDTYINSDLEDTYISGFDTYKITAKGLSVVSVKYDGDFATGLSGSYVSTVEKADGTRIHPSSSTSYGYFALNNAKGLAVLMNGLSSDNIKAYYITVKRDLISNVHIAVNKPNNQFAWDDAKKYIATDQNSINTPCYYNGSAFSALSSPYYATWIKLNVGDTVESSHQISGFNNIGRVVKSGGSYQNILTSPFTATEECAIEIWNSTESTGNIIVTPASSVHVDDQYYGLSGVAFGTSLTARASSSYGFLTDLSLLSGITFDNQGIGSSYILGNMLTAIKAYTGYSGKRVCLLEGFVNDWGNNKTLGTWKDTEETSVCGCVRSALNYMLSQNANMTVFLILDPYGRRYSGSDCSSTAVNSAGLTQFEFYEEVAKVAESLGIPVIKMYAESQISENTPQFILDNIHPNALGAKQSANFIWGKMKQYYPNAIS